MSKKQSNLYQPKNRRVLDEHGNFSKFQEDYDLSEKRLKAAGKTREDLERERFEKIMAKKNLNNSGSQSSAISQLPDELLKKEMEKRFGKSEEEDDGKVPEKTSGDQNPGGSQNPDDQDGSDENLEDLSAAELKAIADEKGIPYKGNASKKKMLELLSDGLISGEEENDEEDDV